MEILQVPSARNAQTLVAFRTPAERTMSGEPSPFSTSGPAMPSRAE
jgi:hypothetical protein